MEIDILFADADESLRSLYYDYFSRKGFSIQTAADNCECITKIREHKPYFVIIDVEMFGDESTSTVLSIAKMLADIPVVIVTGGDSAAQLSQQTGVHVSRCFCKPYSFVTLLKRMSVDAATATIVPARSMNNLASLVGNSVRRDVERLFEVTT